MALFEPTWMGGHPEQLFRQHHGDVADAVPWRVETTDLTDADRDHFRTVWTQSAHQEWCAAGAFVALQEALLRARAPVDLIGASGRFVADEMLHVELACRMAQAYGGGVPLEIDPLAIRPVVDPSLSPSLQAASLAVRVSCVGESLSLPLNAAEFASATDPLSRHVLGRIARDEAAHARIGWWVLDWLAEQLTAADRALLAAVADDAIDALRPALAQAPTRSAEHDAILSQRIGQPLARRGITLAARSWTAQRGEPGPQTA